MKNNKLTLKSLQQELENMKLHSGAKISKSKTARPTIDNITKGGIGHDIKDSFIQRLYMRSGTFSLYLLTGILGYAHKIPFIGRVIAIAAAWYGKTTIWKILVKIRKMFIVFNAIIGVYMVFKTVGFNTDNLLIGFTAMGEAYLQTLFGLINRLFHWFVELFDHKVVPNVPGDSGGTWFSKPSIPKNKSIFIPSNVNIPNILENDTFSLRNLYKDAIPSSTPWYKDTSYLLWLMTIAGTVGAVYIGYKVYTDPSIIMSIFKSNPTINTQAPTPPNDPNDITLGQAATGSIGSSITDVTKGFIKIYKYTVNKLNPLNYFIGVTENQNQFDLFMEVQNDYNRANRSLYPFTNRNPFDSWFKRTKTYYIGEGSKDFVERLQLKNYADRVYDSIQIKGKGVDLGGTSTIFSAPGSPYLSGNTTPTGGLSPVGLNLSKNLPVSDLVTQVKLTALSHSPTNVPTGEWSQHIPDKSQDAYDSFEGWKKVTRGIKNPITPDIDDVAPHKSLYRVRMRNLHSYAQVAAQNTADDTIEPILD